MTGPILEMLQAAMPALLPDTVRQEQRSPAFEITRWAVERLSSQGMVNPDGLWLYHGVGRDERGEREWSVVLKLIKEPGEDATEATNIWYWKREYLAVASGLLSALPPVRFVPPRIFGVEERDGYMWIWMERIVPGVTGRWTPEQYAFVARECGRFNGAYLAGRPLPDYPWLCRRAAYGWAQTFPPQGIWDDPYVIQHFPAGTEARVMRLWDELPRFNEEIDRLPQTFLHGDVQRRNLFLRKGAGGTDEVVVVDWAQCGIGAVGAEVMLLVAGSAVLVELEIDEFPMVEPAVFEAYLGGLRDAGWQGDEELVRLGYCASFAVFGGTSMPSGVANWFSGADDETLVTMFGRTRDQLIVRLVALNDVAHERADEARTLMARRL